MPRAPQKKMIAKEVRPLPAEVLAHLEDGPMTAEAINEAVRSFQKALLERAMKGEMSHHLGYAAGGEKPSGVTNQRNGRTAKTVLTDQGPLRIDVPRDREGTFSPMLIPKHQRRFDGFDERILALYARGLSTRDIRDFLEEQYGTVVSPDLISAVTSEIQEEVTAWQSRPLERMYPVVFFDAMRVKIRDEGVVRIKAVYLALGVLPDGTRDILGIWIENTEGAKFWMRVFNELRARGVEDILIAVTDGLPGMPEALEATYPETTLQTCIVHLIRNSLAWVNWRDRKAVAARLRLIYAATTAEAAEAALTDFEQGPWGEKYPMIAPAWRKVWDRVIPFFAFPPAVRKVIYTTNAIENVNGQLRRAIKTRGHFPSDDAALKLIWLVIRRITRDWRNSVHEWRQAMTQFAILYEGRFTTEAR